MLCNALIYSIIIAQKTNVMQARAHYTRISELIKPFAEEFVNVEGTARNALISTCRHHAAANMRKCASKFFFSQ